MPGPAAGTQCADAVGSGAAVRRRGRHWRRAEGMDGDGGGGGGGLAERPGPGPPLPGPGCRVVIVGGGLAGLGAAQRLTECGLGPGRVPVRVRVLEAREQCGGRVWSRPFGKGLIEMGAQWIHGPSEQNVIFRLASQHHLLDEAAMSEENQAVELNAQHRAVSICYTSSGKRIDPEISASVEGLFSSLLFKSKEFFQTATEPVLSLGEFLKNEIAQCAEEWKNDEEMCKLKLALLNVEFKIECCICGTHSLDLVALQSFGEYISLPGIDCTFPGGFKSLIDEMSKPLPKDMVSFNMPVKCIQWNGSLKTPEALEHAHSVLVECENGEIIPADHVIVTVPLGFLKEHHKTFFNPQLPISKINSIEKMGFGTSNKIFLEFEEPFWDPQHDLIKLVWEDESPLNTRADLQTTWFRKILGFIVLLPAERHGHILLAVLAGQEAIFMEQLSDSEVKDCLTQVIRQFTGNPLQPPPKNILRSKWHSDRFTNGSYSYVEVGSSGDNIDIIAQPLPPESAKAQPLQVLFAGEATHRTFYSTTHGALESGWREADRLREYYLRHTSGEMQNYKT